LHNCGLIGIQIVRVAVPTPQLGRRFHAVHQALHARDHVALDDHRALRRVCEGNVELLGETDGLLEPVSRSTACALGLDDGHRQTGTDLQDVVQTTSGSSRWIPPELTIRLPLTAYSGTI